MNPRERHLLSGEVSVSGGRSVGTPVSCTAAHGCEESRSPSALRPCGLLLFSDASSPGLLILAPREEVGHRLGVLPRPGLPEMLVSFLLSFPTCLTLVHDG